MAGKRNGFTHVKIFIHNNLTVKEIVFRKEKREQQNLIINNKRIMFAFDFI